ncbi:MAG: hypothetical protein LCH31_07655 [Actinobacteria bacterium]|nr:hypothetical protein [Actinomycetota bacterium]
MSSNPPEMPEAPEPGEPQQQLPPVPAELPPMPPELPPIPPQQSYQPYQQYQPAQQQYPPVPQPQYPPGWQPPPPAGGKIWLGILLGAGVPILFAVLSFALSGTDAYQLASLLLMLPFWIMLVIAIVLTILRGTRRTGIGMWIGLAAIPIIGFGACVVAIFGSSF